MAKKSKSRLLRKGVIIPLQVPADIKARIQGIAVKARMSEAAVMRQAMEKGFPELEVFFGVKPEREAA